MFECGPLNVATRLSVPEAVERLSAQVAREIPPPRSEQLVGKVTPSRVVVYRHQPQRGSIFKPIFAGRFADRGGVAVLEGRIGMSRLIPALGVVWFGAGGYGLWDILSSGYYDQSGHLHKFAARALVLPVVLMVMIFVVGFFSLLLFSRWWSQTDAAYIKITIRAALDAQDT